ncbi:MAG: hypothetical protein AAGC68_15555 [Verrucomicrobiota bacterium]
MPSLLLALIAVISFSRWDSSENRGYLFGYYGEFNTVANALEALPDVAIVSSGGTKDVIFEEFHFDVAISGGDPVELWFHESDPIRKLSGKALTKALRKKIAYEVPGPRFL